MNKENRKILITKILYALLSGAMLTLAYFYLRHLPAYITLAAFILIATEGVFICGINVEKHAVIYKFLLTAAVFTAAVMVGYIILYETGVLETVNSFDALKQAILDTKQWGVITYIGLTIVGVVILPLPGPVTVLIGVAIYGSIWAFVLSLIGTIAGSLISFVLGKVFGKKLVSWMVGEDKYEKYAELLNDKGRYFFVMMMLFPGFPDDILCLVAGATAMTYKFFLISVSLTRPVMIALYSFLGSGSVIPFSGWGIPVWIAIICIGVVLFLLLNRFKDKLTVRKKKKENKSETKTGS